MLRSIRVFGTSNSAFSLFKRPVFFFALEAVASEAVALDGVALEGVALEGETLVCGTLEGWPSEANGIKSTASEGVAILSNAPFSTKLLFFSGSNTSDDSVPCGSSFVLCKLNPLLYTPPLYSEDVTILISIGISSVWLP